MGTCLCRPKYDFIGGDSTSDWMSRINGQRSTSNISMPGTHESMCLYGGCWLRCQTLTLTRQYQAGIRFVDIRCRHFNDELPIHHDAVYQHATFDDVLKATLMFLAEHSQEIIFLRVKEEYLPRYNTNTFAETVQIYVDRYPSERFWAGKTYPTLGEARGKVVVLRNYYGPATFGLPYDNLDIEDMWDVGSLTLKDIDRKWDLVSSHLEQAENGPTSTMFLTYSSGTGVFAWPCAIARRLNKSLLNFFGGKGRFGIVAMDFPDFKLIGKIVDSNSEELEIIL